MLAYWTIVILIIFFIIMGGHLDFKSWLISLNPYSPISVPFTWLITPFIVLGIIGTYVAWSGYPLKRLPRPRTPISQYNPFRRKKPDTRDDQGELCSRLIIGAPVLAAPVAFLIALLVVSLVGVFFRIPGRGRMSSGKFATVGPILFIVVLVSTYAILSAARVVYMPLP